MLKKLLKERLHRIYDYYENGIHPDAPRMTPFIQSGLFVLSLLFIAGIAFSAMQPARQRESIETAVSGTQLIKNKKLPIYCVDTPQKRVALSFDAAWGDGRLM